MHADFKATFDYKCIYAVSTAPSFATDPSPITIVYG